MPFAENERRLRRDDDRQRGDRSALAQDAHEKPRVVLVLVRPAESNDTPGEIREPAHEMAVDRFTVTRERVGGEREARVEQALALASPPGLELAGRHARRREQSKRIPGRRSRTRCEGCEGRVLLFMRCFRFAA